MRAIDANLNRASEALRVLEEVSRFHLDDETLSKQLKNLRHKVCCSLDGSYAKLLESRDTENDVGVGIENLSRTSMPDIAGVFRANIKRLQQALRVLFEYTNNGLFEQARYESYTLEKVMWGRLEMDINRMRLGNRRLYLVTNSDAFEDDSKFLDAVAGALSGGVDVLQLREKNSSAKRIIELGKRLRELCSIYNTLFIMNDRIDIAKVVEADGVHLGQDDPEVALAREILGKQAIVGVSTHCKEQALQAIADGADYIGVGPVFATPTKQGRMPVGLEYVGWASGNIDIPWFAIGGIDGGNLEQVTRAGAKRVAVVRAIINSASPKQAAIDILQRLKGSDRVN